MTSKHRITVNLSEDEYQKLLVIAEEHRVSMAWIARTSINNFLENYRNNPSQLPLVLGSEGASSKK